MKPRSKPKYNRTVLKVYVSDEKKYVRMTYKEIKERYGLASEIAARGRIGRSPYSTVIEDDSIFKTQPPPPLIIDGVTVSRGRAVKDYKISHRKLKELIEEHGLTLTTELIDGKRRVPKEKTRQMIGVTPEEREALSKIKGPSEYELKYFPDAGSNGIAPKSTFTSAKINL